MLGAIIALVFGAIAAGVKWSDASWTPKLALDLEGGTQIVLRAVSATTPTSTQMNQAIDVMRQRVDASGVAEAEITTQGSNLIVVGLPGKPSEDTLKLVKTSAQMEFRPVLAEAAPTPTTDDATASPSATPTADATAGASGDATTEPTTEPTSEPTSEPTESATAEPTPAATTSTKAAPDNASDSDYYVTPAVQEQFDKLDCTDQKNLTGGVNGDADKAFVTCQQQGLAKYILGPVEVEGKHIASATSGLNTLQNGQVGNEWIVQLKFDKTGTSQFSDVTERLYTEESPKNQFGIVLDGLVVSAPSVNGVIPNGEAEISGSFTRESAASLANQLNFGSLPMAFEVQSEEQISATLGADQLQKGMLAGLIGLILVVLYSLLQYRTLGLLTVGSLVVAAVLTYGTITLLSWGMGYRLSLPGVTGLIVAIGITADSFIVYFERIRDELREGRTLGTAVERGWSRAKRTILASDAVNLLAAAVLLKLAVGGVKGFAFTLGLTTIIDVLVVFMFTHPMMELLARTKFFSQGHRLSGLDPRRLGVPGTRYVGRGKVVTGPRSSSDGMPDAPGDDVPDAAPTRTPVPATVGGVSTAGMTIAERRAAQRAAQAEQERGAASEADESAAADAATDDDASGRTDGSEH